MKTKFLSSGNPVFFRQKGVAIISVLIALAVITGIVAQLTRNQFLAHKRAGQILHREQALMFMFAAEAAAKSGLNLDKKQNEIDYYSPDELWNVTIDEVYDGGRIQAVLEELNGRININNLRRLPTLEETNSGKSDVNLESQWHSVLLMFVENIGLEKLDTPAALVDSLADWMDTDQQQREFGAEDGNYVTSGGNDSPTAPHTSGHYLSSVREIVQVSGFQDLFAEAEQFQRLEQNLVALPLSDMKVNVNTATAEVLQSLEKKGRFTADAATSVTERRKGEPFEKLDDFYSHMDSEYPVTEPDKKNKNRMVTVSWKKLVPKKMLSVASDFFLLTTVLSFGEADMSVSSYLQRTKEGNVRVIARNVAPY